MITGSADFLVGITSVDTPFEPSATAAEINDASQQFKQKEDINGTPDEPHKTIISFSDGDPEDPYNWPMVRLATSQDKDTVLIIHTAEEGFHLDLWNRCCRQQHVGILVTQWSNRLHWPVFPCYERPAARPSNLSFSSRLCPRASIFRAAQRDVWKKGYNAGKLRGFHHLHNGLCAGTELASFPGIPSDLWHQRFKRDSRGGRSICRCIWRSRRSWTGNGNLHGSTSKAPLIQTLADLSTRLPHAVHSWHQSYRASSPWSAGAGPSGSLS